MERLKKIKDTLLCEIESQLCGNLALVDTKEFIAMENGVAISDLSCSHALQTREYYNRK